MRETTNNQIPNFKAEGARLIFKNFSGAPSQYNAEGNRNFAVVLNEEDYEMLKADGWNVKRKEARDDDESDLLYLPVKVKFGKIPPIINMVTTRGKIRLDEETVSQLDWARLKNVDLVIRPYRYPEMPGRPSGISAYLKSMYATIEEDEFDVKYADIPDLN